MRTIRISDTTLRQKAADTLTFKEKLELARLLDRLCVDVIELGPIVNEKADSLYIKSVANTVRDSVISVPAGPDIKSVDLIREAIKGAAKARIQIKAPVSLVQMEYLHHLQPEKLKEKVCETINYALSVCSDVEFCAEDATRADETFVCDILEAAINAGASTVTVCDESGKMLPDEYSAFVEVIKAGVPSLGKASLGIYASDHIAMSEACSIAAVKAGASEIKAAIYADGGASVKNLANLIQMRGSDYGIESRIRTVELSRLAGQAERMFTQVRSKTSPFDSGVRSFSDELSFSAGDDISAIRTETARLGYDLNEEDLLKVYEQFRKLTERKERISEREIDAIVASFAMQVPPTYKLEDYIINSGNVISATAHIRIRKNDELKESVAIGDGPVDASFLAIEQIAGMHFELDDFQIQAVTEGREAMGEALVKLRHNGKVYSGRGLSTDIIGASIKAYVNALNKISYEEAAE